MRTSLLFALLLLVAVPASAQPVQRWTLRVYNVGAPQPLSAPTDLLASNVSCNVNPATIIAASLNPSRVVWDDVGALGKVCVWTDPGTGPLASTPFGGNYEATLTATNSVSTSPESTRAPFEHPGVAPLAPSGVLLAK